MDTKSMKTRQIQKKKNKLYLATNIYVKINSFSFFILAVLQKKYIRHPASANHEKLALKLFQLWATFKRNLCKIKKDKQYWKKCYNKVLTFLIFLSILAVNLFLFQKKIIIKIKRNWKIKLNTRKCIKV